MRVYVGVIVVVVVAVVVAVCSCCVFVATFVVTGVCRIAGVVVVVVYYTSVWCVVFIGFDTCVVVVWGYRC